MKTITKIALVTASVYLLGGCVFTIGANTLDADVELSEELSIDASDIKSMSIDAGAGELEIVGRDDIDEIIVTADIRTTEKRDYVLSLERNGDRATLIAQSESYNGNWISGFNRYPKIDVTVSVPSSLLLDIEDGSGDLSLKNMCNAVEIEDGSGNIEVKNIAGILTIDDGSGDIRLENISGDLLVKDNSGDLRIDTVAGEVSIDDGSGDTTVFSVSRGVTIEDNSGNITLKDIGGAVSVDDGSGDINISDIGGKATIDDNSGDISINGAEAVLIVDDGSGGTNFKNIRGTIEDNS